MKKRPAYPRNCISLAIAALCGISSGGALAQLEEVVVTAQKRSQSVNDVPMSISAATGEQMERQGIFGVGDLVKVIPGFTYQPSDYGTPVYTIRGIGFKDVAVAVAPTVTVYVDQVPLPYSAMTSGVMLDLERVEVLKGPQGTLFGQNSTGGAMNFIAAKPTDELDAKVMASYGEYNSWNIEGAISGPLSNTLSARVALRTEKRDEWQESTSNNDELGERDFTTGRLLLDWNPSDVLSFQLNVSAWQDKSDTQAAQFVQFAPTQPAEAGGFTDQFPALMAETPPGDHAELADWDTGADLTRDDSFEQISLRADWDIGDNMTITSISSWADFEQDGTTIDTDGTDVNNFLLTIDASIESFSQELRIAGETDDGGFKWMAGLNYQTDETMDNQTGNYSASNSGTPIFDDMGNVIGANRWTSFTNRNNQEIDTAAVFASLDFALTDRLTAQASARYTDSQRDFDGCVFDTGDGGLAAGFGFFTTNIIPAGACATVDPATGLSVSPFVENSLDEDNTSWRLGLHWNPEWSEDLLLYTNITQGYKAGSFPTVPGLTPDQFDPIEQESVLAYEIGFKIPLLEQTMQLDGAVFYYDYEDKQLIGFISTAFGNLPGLVSIPESSVTGAELNLSWRPVSEFLLKGGITYVDSEVTEDFASNDPFNNLVNLKGEAFPNTPEWQGNLDMQYDLAITNAVSAYFGASLTYRDDSFSAFGESPVYVLESYKLVDLRIGIESENWRAEMWGRNVTDEHYKQSVTHVVDTVAQVTGMPATYGVTVSYRM